MEKRCLGCMKKFPENLSICPYCGYVVGTKAEEPIHMDPGTLLYDRYIIGKVLGYGGFGVTYIAWDNKLEQPVAIKEYLPGEFSTRMPGRTQITVLGGNKGEQFLSGLNKFVDEAKRLSKFPSEEGIVQIIDTFKENDTAYLVMEYLDGMTLKEYIQENGIIPEDEAVDMLMPIMKSLEVVHAEGLIHRDIAPDNIFITKNGKVKLIDFGASRYATTTHSRSLTVLVKPGYSPEEQYRSRSDQGPYTDVYSLAATMYKMMTGKTPPDALDRRALYESKNKDIVVPMRKLNKHISRNRENAILNGMNVKIEDRTPDIASFISELQADPPVKRRYGTIKKIDVYSWPLWLKIVVPAVIALLVAGGIFLAVKGINSLFGNGVTVTEGFVKVPSIVGFKEEKAQEKLKDSELNYKLVESEYSPYVEVGMVSYQNPNAKIEVKKGTTVKYRVALVSDEDAVVVDENGNIEIESLVGMSVEHATELLKAAGLNVNTVEEYSNEVEAGVVMEQDKLSTVKQGETITLKVSKGPAAFEMIDVRGMKLEEAESKLNEKGLVVTPEYKKDNTVEEGCVISQKPESGTSVMSEDNVVLVISSGKETVTVENVLGSARESAVNRLETQGFKVVVAEEYSTEVAKDNVTRTYPEAGSQQIYGSNITVYVSKGKQPVKVTYDANGGSVSPSSETKYYSDVYGTLPTPTRKGYVFSGWYAENGNSEVTSSTKVSYSEDHKIIAKWSSGEYKLSFEANGGNPVSNKAVNFEKTYGELPIPTKDGYTFKGWFTSANGGTQVTSSTTVTTDSDHKLYAQWDANKYTIRFDGNGETSGATASLPMVYDESKSLTANGFTKAGYTFTGWKSDDGKTYTDKQSVKNLANTPDGNVVLKAQWKANQYTVKFNGNGSTSGSMSDMSMTYDESKNLVVNGFAKIGYTFTGWKSNEGKTYTDKQAVKNLVDSSNGSIVLNAQWKANQYTIKFNGNGSTSGSMSDMSMTYDESKNLMANGFVKTGYTFTGWKSDDGKTYNDKQSVKNLIDLSNGSVMLKAQWRINEYQVSWNNGVGYSINVKRTASPNKGAATGYLSNGATIFTGDVLSVSYYKDDYYTLGLTGKTSITVSGDVTSSDIYATAFQNPLSDWVAESSVPNDAKIVDEKIQYRYREKQTKESKYSSESGWTLYDSQRISSGYWGNWSAWSTDYVASSSTRRVESKSENGEAIYVMHFWLTQDAKKPYYRHYWSYEHAAERDTFGTLYSENVWGEITKTQSQLNSLKTVKPGEWSSSGTYGGKNCSNQMGYIDTDGKILFIKSSKYPSVTYYRYRDYVDTSYTLYYYYKWGSWSSWIDGRVAYSPDSFDVETRTLVKYIMK